MNQDNENTEKSGGKSPELQRVERYFKEIEKRDAALRETMAAVQSAGWKWRLGAATCFFGAVMSWWITRKIPATVALAIVGLILFLIALVQQKRSEPKP